MPEINVGGNIVLLDLDDLHLVARGLGVHIRSNGYAAVQFTCGKYNGQYLSRTILGCKPWEEADHKNGNPLDNRRNNLRISTRTQNLCNRIPSRVKESDLPRGVYKNGKSFQAKITHNGIEMHLGLYSKPEIASYVYQKAAERLQGEYAYHLSRVKE